MNDSSNPSEEKLGQLLASYHEQLRDQETPAVEIANLSAEEREQFRRLRDCLVQLEHLRAAEKSLNVEGEPAPPTVAGER